MNETGQPPAAPAFPPPAFPPIGQDAFAARCLMRAAAEASLATVTEGQPFASLATPACAPDLSILLFLSRLSAHTRHLARDGRCSLLFAGAAEGPNPQTRPRVTVTGVAHLVEGEEEARLKPLWLARHPYAALYAGFGDFGLWRIEPQAALFVGGFARARPIEAAALRPDPQAVAAIEAAAARIAAHMNEDHGDATDAIANHLLGQPGSGWRFAGLDVDGCWLTHGEGETQRVARLAFPAPVAEARAVREALVAATREAEAKAGG